LVLAQRIVWNGFRSLVQVLLRNSDYIVWSNSVVVSFAHIHIVIIKNLGHLNQTFLLLGWDQLNLLYYLRPIVLDFGLSKLRLNLIGGGVGIGSNGFLSLLTHLEGKASHLVYFYVRLLAFLLSGALFLITLIIFVSTDCLVIYCIFVLCLLIRNIFLEELFSRDLGHNWT